MSLMNTVEHKSMVTAIRLPISKANSSWLGIDITKHSIKIVEFEQAGSHSRLLNYKIQDMDTASDEPIVDFVDTLKALSKYFKSTKAYISVSGFNVSLHRTVVPPMPKKELPEAIKWQIKNELPFPIDNTIIDFKQIPQTQDSKSQGCLMLVAAAEMLFVENLIKSVERGGITVESVLPGPSAFFKSLEGCLPELFNRDAVLTIEITRSESHMSILNKGQPVMVRNIAFGSANFADALISETASEQGTIVIDRRKAEQLILQYGIPAPNAEGTIDEGISLFHVASLMRPALESIVTEIARFISFYRLENQSIPIQCAILSGGGANLKNFKDHLEQGLELPVYIFNPLKECSQDCSSYPKAQIINDGTRLAKAIGLAIDRGQGLNLLPPTIKKARAVKIKQAFWITSFRGVLATALIVYLALLALASILEADINNKQAEWKIAEPIYQQYQNIQAQYNDLQSRIEQVQFKLNREPSWLGLFKELSRLTPDSIVLQMFEVKASSDLSPTVFLSGHTVSQPSKDKSGISDFVKDLESSPFFCNMQLVSSEFSSINQSTINFEIEGLLE